MAERPRGFESRLFRVKDIDVAWVAGILEGEGSFMLKTNSPVLKVQATMTDLDVLERVQAVFGGSIYKINRDRDSYPTHWKDGWVWNATGDTAKTVMEAILPYMGKRRSEKINELLEARVGYDSKVEAWKNLCTEAANYYLNNDTTLHKTGAIYGISWETVRRHVKRVRSERLQEV